MTIYLLNEAIAFPDPRKTDDPSGILAVGGDLSPARLLLAYSLGIFPWYDDAYSPILWHCPDDRFVIRPDHYRLGRSLRKAVNNFEGQFSYNRSFSEVLELCASVPRHDQLGTWLNAEMKTAYLKLHQLGYAQSAEVWRNGRLIGGLYGVTLGAVFFGESMFSVEPAASKALFAELVPQLWAAGYQLIDCQIYTEHLARFGGLEIERDTFLSELKTALAEKPKAIWPASVS